MSASKIRVTVRPAQPLDAQVVARIHNEGVEDRVATFQVEPSAVADFAQRIARADGRLMLVAECAEGLIGWAAVVPSSRYGFYSGVGEYQIYVDRELRGRGVGAQLLARLVEEARAAGYHKLVGRLFADNSASIELAHACGFRDVGVHLRHGRLDGEWRDVLLVERSIGEAVAR